MNQESAVEHKDVSVLKSYIKEIAADIKLAKNVLKDGVNADDVKFVPEAIDHIKAGIALAAKLKEAGLEFKDIDAAEVGELLMEAWTDGQDVIKG
jgi:tRNA A37 threonylcarbamoyladenosine dehydratase